jgi:hypothetical protein
LKREELDKELSILNNKVIDSIKERTKWLDEHMKDVAKFQIGDKIFNSNGKELGVVSEYYRYWASQNIMYDTTLSVCYKYRVNPYDSFCPTYDNTSRQIGCSFLTEEEVKARFK